MSVGSIENPRVKGELLFDMRTSTEIILFLLHADFAFHGAIFCIYFLEEVVQMNRVRVRMKEEAEISHQQIRRWMSIADLKCIQVHLIFSYRITAASHLMFVIDQITHNDCFERREAGSFIEAFEDDSHKLQKLLPSLT